MFIMRHRYWKVKAYPAYFPDCSLKWTAKLRVKADNDVGGGIRPIEKSRADEFGRAALLSQGPPAGHTPAVRMWVHDQLSPGARVVRQGRSENACPRSARPGRPCHGSMQRKPGMPGLLQSSV